MSNVIQLNCLEPQGVKKYHFLHACILLFWDPLQFESCTSYSCTTNNNCTYNIIALLIYFACVWIRGRSDSLRAAEPVDQMDQRVPGGDQTRRRDGDV